MYPTLFPSRVPPALRLTACGSHRQGSHETIRQRKTPPSGGRTESLRKGLSGMDAARAPMGQGWPFGAGPWSNDGVREPRRRRGRMSGASPFGSFWGDCQKEPAQQGGTETLSSTISSSGTNRYYATASGCTSGAAALKASRDKQRSSIASRRGKPSISQEKRRALYSCGITQASR